MFGPEEEERVAVSPGLVVVPAGCTDRQSEGGLTEDEQTCGLARLGLDMAGQNCSLELQLEVET